MCHGIAGDGRGPAARWLDAPPRDFTRGEYKFRTTPLGALPTDNDLMKTLSRGIAGSQMPSYEGRLSYRERAALIGYIKGFSKRFSDPGEQCTAERRCDSGFTCMSGRCVLYIPPVQRASSATVSQGRVLYSKLGCVECHGADGRGDGPPRAS